jgi:hypothetical protein
LDILREASASPSVTPSPPSPEHGAYSEWWAGNVRPVAFFLFILLALVMMVPFVILAAFPPKEGVATQAMDWGKTVLPPLTGFVGAVVGYYFGTRNSKSETPPPPNPNKPA